MNTSTDHKLILVIRETRLDELITRFNTEAQIDYVIERLAAKVDQLRALNPLNETGDGEVDLRAIRYGEPLQ